MLNKFKYIFLILVLIFQSLLLSFSQADNIFDLQNLIDYATLNNSELAQIELDIKKAEFDLQIAKAKKFPSISFSVSLSYLTNPIGPISISAGQLGSITTANGDILIPPEDMLIYKGMENTFYQFKITIDQPLFTWGKIDNAIDLYSLLLSGAKLKKFEKIDEIKGKVKIYYFSLYYLDKIFRTMQEQNEIINRLVSISKQSYDNGFITYSEYLQSLVSQKEFEFNFKRVENERQNAFNGLKSVLNYPLDKDLTISFESFSNILKEKEVIFYDIPDNIWQLAKENNLQLKQLEIFKRVVEKQYEIILASGYFKPDIGLRIEISYSGPRFPLLQTGWFTSDDYNITLSLGISSTIFDAGSLEAKIKQAKNELIKMYAQIEYANQNLENMLESIKLKSEVNKAKIDYYLIKIEVDKQMIESKEQAFQSGELQEVDFLKFRLNLYTDLISLYLEAIDYYTNYYSIETICAFMF